MTHQSSSAVRRLAARLAVLALLACPRAAAAQAPSAPQDDPDLDTNVSQPDFTLTALPTTLRLARHKSAFRVTHRFARPLGQGDFGDLLDDFFGFDSGALIGLEYRFGLMRGTQVGLYRTSDKTIQFFGVRSIRTQGDRSPLGIAIQVSVDGTHNFRDEYRPGVALLVSREIGTHGALYVEPAFVANTNPLPADAAGDNHTAVVALGARLRARPTVYVVLEATPRVAGYAPGVTQFSVGLEKRLGGHAFQISVANGFGSTLAQLARGGVSHDDWFIGFNITRKFF
ncbi:MAG: DUF5777 family beta-barrel protein [Vicinamibacterales bacterium]